ncbi:electron transfer flavoprotein subunit alpha/FixB family protein [Candidatus Bathyarchaeota archaeon]|nr:electron transfer flavoprotein subunit alpha/FixB family protein [Candidatus Bathyarchaeota archaeon]
MTVNDVPDADGVLVFAEQNSGAVHPVSFELLGKGRDLVERLGVKLSAALLGHGVRKEALELVYYGADVVYVFDSPILSMFDPVQYTKNLVKLVTETRPAIFLLGATRLGRSLAPRIAAALRTGLTADCVDLELDENRNLVQVRPAFSGNIMAQIKTKTRPQMATVRYKVMKANARDPRRKGKVIVKEPEALSDTGIQILEKTSVGEVNLAEAEVIVSGGRGLKSPSDFALLEELAKELGGVVGSSRPLVDAGWISRDHQVGFSGHTVKPRVYVACGISGSPQHLFGMRDSDVIIAINKDSSAPIFSVADYLVVGDIYEIVPLLVQELRKLKAVKNLNERK